MRLSALLGAVSIGCCASMPQTHVYRLEPPSVTTAPAPVAGTLAVEALRVDPVYEDERIVYRTSAHSLEYYNYHRWSAPPSLHLTHYLRDAFSKTGLFREVSTELSGRTDATLTGHVTVFEEVDVSETSWMAHVALELHLVDTRSGTILWSDHFAEQQPLETRNPEGLAAALSSAMQRVVERSAPALAEAMQKPSESDRSEARLPSAERTEEVSDSVPR